MEYTLKHVPEDFVVDEMYSYHFNESGPYTYYILNKRNCTTLQAITTTSLQLHIPLKSITYAGTKDKRAVTTQMVCIARGKNKNFDFGDCSLFFKGYREDPLFLGCLDGNKFSITIRNLEFVPFHELTRIVNYFGEQRFSSHNVLIGKLLLHKEFDKALEIIMEKNTISMDAKNPIASLKKIPQKLLLLYIHSVQSDIWNKTAQKCVEEGIETATIPLVGFGSEIPHHLLSIMNTIMSEEGITFRDFVLRPFPELSSEGGERLFYEQIKDWRIITFGEDEYFPLRKKVVVEFSLFKGVYATEVLRQWLV